MGSAQSSHAKNDTKTSSIKKKSLPLDVRGRKSIPTPEVLKQEPYPMDNAEETSPAETEAVADEDSSTEDESDDDYDSEDEEDAEYLEFLQERRAILEDARRMKQLATFFLHPEKPVEEDGTACGRNYFSRPSAPEQQDPEEAAEEAQEQALIMADLQALKKLAVDYMHPELPVEVDSTATARNYFDRASAPELESYEEAEERAAVLSDARELKKLAVDYHHPELPVMTTDPTACGRNYFDRASAMEEEEWEDAEERARILEEAKALKKLAVDYHHPELPVVTTDPTACGRNYFSRASAPEQVSLEDAMEYERMLEDSKALKQLAVDYLHPERPVEVDSTAFGRNYFDRPSAPEEEEWEDAEERARILEEAKALKKLAIDYMHPERPVVTTDPNACGRNYFGRPSALSEEDVEEAEERARILADAKALKKLAVDYHHPELPMVTTDPTACGRNYFSRFSAPEEEEWEDAEERARILAEAKELKEMAVAYHHPELPVVTTDPTAFGRNYFLRPSAPQQESSEDAEEAARILQDAKALKKVAIDYMHPELPVVTTDPTACGRNYFSRPSAPEEEDAEFAEERARILAEAKELKKLAVDYHHPERPVVTTDPTACGRNYFDRPSAWGHYEMIHTFPEHEHEVYHDEHHHEHLDHFGMDEEMEMLADMRASLVLPEANKPQAVAESGEKEGGNLSRSPSSIFEPLYDE